MKRFDAATACDQECSRMETLRTDAFAAEAWGVSQWLSVKNSARIKAPDWVRIVSDFK